MIKTRITKDESGTIDLCETYSTTGANLLQIETGIEYGNSVIDVIKSHDPDGNPISKYNYSELETEATAEDYLKALERFGVYDDE